MLKKCLIALALVVFASGPVLADETWGYGVTTTVTWEWDVKRGPDICVKMKVVMWADLYYCDPDITCIILTQEPGDQTPGQDGGNSYFSGCICMKLCNNFPGIDVGVKYIPSVDVTKADKNKGYAISIGTADALPTNWAVQPSDTFHTNDIHLSNGLLTLKICVRVKEVDPQAMAFTGFDTLHTIGKVETTLTPTIAPPGYSGTNPWTDSEYNPPAIP